MKVFANLIPLVFLFMSFSCEPDPAEELVICPVLPPEASCTENIPCLEFFNTIQVQLRNPEGEAVSLDSFQSKNLISGVVYTMEQWPETATNTAGLYPLLSDSELKTISSNGTPVEFTGFKDGAEVVKRIFIIGHDCCHIMLISGEPEIILTTY
ncbi:hypothetical protein D770_04610 [Flammeovirgaceae bacterium 311]|nr:hypothetical protein D770_04610 [Flammeovirgaceae bacterium 311]